MLPNVSHDRDNDWLASSDCVQALPVALVVGAVYRFRGFRADRPGFWVVPPGDYCLVGVARSVRTFQDQVVYRGAGGPDDGQLFVCTLDDWSKNFSPTEAEGA